MTSFAGGGGIRANMDTVLIILGAVAIVWIVLAAISMIRLAGRR